MELNEMDKRILNYLFRSRRWTIEGNIARRVNVNIRYLKNNLEELERNNYIEKKKIKRRKRPVEIMEESFRGGKFKPTKEIGIEYRITKKGINKLRKK